MLGHIWSVDPTDETLPVINKTKAPKTRENIKNKMEGLTSKKTKRTTKEGKPQGEHQVPEPLPVVISISYRIRN